MELLLTFEDGADGGSADTVCKVELRMIRSEASSGTPGFIDSLPKDCAKT